MKMLPLGVVVLLLPSANLFGAWSVQTTPTAYNLQGVSFVDATLGWACGDFGTIIHTSTGGDTWDLQDSQTFDHLHSIYFVDDSNGWAVGALGTIRHTADGGATWGTQISGVAYDLYGVYFLDQTEGWAVGAAGTILHTVNAGTTWSAIFPTIDQYLDVFFWDQNEGWLCGRTGSGGTVGHTTDQGSNWSFQYPSLNWLHDIHFVDSDNGWVCGTNGEVMRTTNGEDWSAQTSGVSYHLNGIWTVDLNRGWTVGNAGTIRKTANGGSTWGPDTSGVSVHLNGVWFTDSNNGWAVGESGTIIRYGVVGVEEQESDIRHPLDFARDRQASGIRLLQNCPNPFGAGGSTIPFNVERVTCNVSLSIYDLSGCLVRTLLDESSNAGNIPQSGQVVWDGKDEAGREVASGVYFYQLKMGAFRQTRKLTLLR